jgi:putative ABC transport system permease protein
MIALQLALKNVYRKRERSFLTIIGVLLAVGSFISLLSIAEGMYQRVDREVNGRNVDIYILPSDGASLPTGPIGSIGFSTEVIPISVAEKLKAFGDVTNVCPIYRIQHKIGGQTMIIVGIESDKVAGFFPHFKPGGRMFYRENDEIVVGGSIAYQKGIRIDTPVVIKDRTFETVGLVTPTGAFQDYFSFISLENAMKLDEAKGYQEVWVQLRNSDRKSRETAASKLKTLFPGLKILTREEYLGNANEYVRFAWILQFAIASIGVLISMTAAMNTMLMSTYERIKEFGTLRSIGATRYTVLMMILLESLILTFMGGVGGLVLGIMGSRVLDEAVKALMQISIPLATITWGLILNGIILSIVVGVVGAVIPAIIVYRMNIINALRWE